MEKSLKNLTIFEFQTKFPDDRACIEFLAEQKWKVGFVCPKCGHTHSCRGINEFDRQCTRCRRLCSPTSGTPFHRLKFSPLKALYFVYYMMTNKSGISSKELSRRLDLHPKACHAFHAKITLALCSSTQSQFFSKMRVEIHASKSPTYAPVRDMDLAHIQVSV